MQLKNQHIYIFFKFFSLCLQKQYEEYLIRMWSSKKAITYNTPQNSVAPSLAHSIRNFQLSSPFQPQEFTRFKSDFVQSIQEQPPIKPLQPNNFHPNNNYNSNTPSYHSPQATFHQENYPKYIPQEPAYGSQNNYYQQQLYQHPRQPTMNYSVYNHSQLQHPPTTSALYASDIKSTKAFNPACKPLVGDDINNMVKFDEVSTTYYKNLNIPSTEPKIAKKSKRFSVPNIMIHLSDDEDETGEKALRMDQTNADTLDKCELKLPPTEFNNLSKIQAKSTTSIEGKVGTLITEQLYGAKENQEETVAGPFVIPKIIVQPQSELATSTPALAGQTNTLLLQSDNRVDSPPQVSAENISMNYPANANNSNIESSIELSDKMPQNQQQYSTRVNEDLNANYENSGNSSVDDPVLHSSDPELNDKISQIYQKIEKMEDKYYGEKVKIIENFGGLEQPPSDAPILDEVLAVNVDDGNYMLNEIPEEREIMDPAVLDQPQDLQGLSQTYNENFEENIDNFEEIANNENYHQYQQEVVENSENYPHYEYNATQPIFESQDFNPQDEQANYFVPPIEITQADEEPQASSDNQQEYYDPNYIQNIPQDVQPEYDSNYLEPEYQQQNTQQYYQEIPEPEYQQDAANSNYSHDNNYYPETVPQYSSEFIENNENQESQQPAIYEQPIDRIDSTDVINYETNLSNEEVNLEPNDEAVHQPIELQDEQPIQQSSVENYAPQVEKTSQFAEEAPDIDAPQIQQPTELIPEPAEINMQNYVDVEQTEEEYETEVDESFATTISSSETNKQHKALELHTAAASGNDDVAIEPQLKQQTDASQDDVKMVKKLLDSESDESSTVQAPAKEIVDESDFEFSAAS